MISQGFFYGFEPRTELLTLLPGLSLCREGIVYGAVVSLRLLSVLSAGALVVFTTYPSDLILALTKLRVPHSFAFMLTLALRFLPETIEQGKRILVAQQLRGAGGKGLLSAFRRFRLLVVPLLVVSLRSARQVALAAEVRAYSSNRVPSRDLRFAIADWAVLAGLILLTAIGVTAAVLGHGAAPARDSMMLLWLYIGSVLGLLVAIGGVVVAGVRRRAFQPFTTLELATAALLICLLHVAVVPWQIGLAKVPGLDALIFSIPYTAIFLLGLRLVPKPGIATLLIFGQGLFGQLLGRGINPAWWPYYLWCALAVEVFLLVGGRPTAELASHAGGRSAPGPYCLLLYVPDPRPFSLAPVLRPVVRWTQDRDGHDRLRHRHRARVATCTGN